MTLLEFLDRWDERRLRTRRPPRDIRQLIGFMFLAGYYALVWRFYDKEVPAANIELITACLLTLGPPVGIIVGAMFRTDRRDEQAAENTGKGFDALAEQAKAVQAATGTPPEPHP